MKENVTVIGYEHPGTLIPMIAEPYGPFGTLLDVGGGRGVVGRGYWKVHRIHVLDIFVPESIPENFTRGHALDAVRIYGAKSFDVVQCTEVIEHLPKEDGPLLLRALEAVARRLVVISTPNGFLRQDPEDHPGEAWAKNPHERHLCGYSPGELVDLGYEVLINEAPGDEREKDQIVAWKDVR